MVEGGADVEEVGVEEKGGGEGAEPKVTAELGAAEAPDGERRGVFGREDWSWGGVGEGFFGEGVGGGGGGEEWTAGFGNAAAHLGGEARLSLVRCW